MGYVISFLGLCLAILVGVFWAYRTGRKEEKFTKSEQIYQAALRAQHYRDRMSWDRSYAERLRERFTR